MNIADDGQKKLFSVNEDRFVPAAKQRTVAMMHPVKLLRIDPVEVPHRCWGCVPFRSMPDIGELACFEMKMIGKPYAGEPHVRFDEGEQDIVLRTILNGHEVGNDGYSQEST